MIVETSDNKLYAVTEVFGVPQAWEGVPVRRAKIRGTYERRPNDTQVRLIRKDAAKIVAQFKLRD